MALTTPSQDTGHPSVELLVINGHEPSRLGLGVMLQRESWVSRCLLAGDEQRGRLLAEKRRPAVVVLDVSDLGPFAGSAIQALRQVRPGLQVVLTAHCPSVSVANPKAIGAAAFLPAGATSAQIVATVHAALHEEEPPVVEAAPIAHAAAPLPTGNLSQRERDVLALLATGATNREIAAQLYLGPDTVKKHASSVYRKLGVRNRTEATQQAAGLLAAA